MDLSEFGSQQWMMVVMINVNFVFILFISHWLYKLNQRLVKVNPFLDALTADEHKVAGVDMDSMMMDERLLMVEKAIRKMQTAPAETVEAVSSNVAYADAMGLARQGANISDISKQCYLSSSEAQLIKRMQAHETLSV